MWLIRGNAVQYSLLSALASRGAADQTTLAANIALDRTTTTGALRRLEARGLVERTVSREDQRARACKLTPDGAQLLTRMEAAAREAHRATVAPLSTEEQEVLIRLLARIVNANSDCTVPPVTIG